MDLGVNGPESALFGLRELQQTTQRLAGVQERLATFERINRAADDAAGLAVSEGFRAQIRGFNQEVRGIQAGINFVQTAGGALGAQSDAVGRLRDLAVQASDGTLNTEQRAALNNEAQELVAQVDAVGRETEFNGLRPLDGSTGAVTIGGGTSPRIDC